MSYATSEWVPSLRSITGRSFGILALAMVLAGCAMTGTARTPVPLSVADARQGLLRAGLHAAAVETAHGTLRYFEGGRGSRTLVLIHGSGRQAGDWQAIAGVLGRHSTLLVPDLPGHGESAPATGPLPVADLVAGLEALLDARRPGTRVTLVGNSLGGWVALLYAARHPERVERVVGIDSSGIYAPLKVPLMPKTRDEAAKLVAAIRGPHAPQATDAELDAVVAAVAAGPVPRLVAGLRAEDFLDLRAGQIAVPVDLLWGEDDGVLPPDYGRRLAALLPRSHFRLLPACGHMPQVFCPDTLATALGEVLASAPPAARPPATAAPAPR